MAVSEGFRSWRKTHDDTRFLNEIFAFSSNCEILACLGVGMRLGSGRAMSETVYCCGESCLDLISTKLPIVKGLIEIVIHASTNGLEQYENGSRQTGTPLHGVKPPVYSQDTCKAQEETRKDHKKT